jgi:nucleoside phosphorylase
MSTGRGTHDLGLIIPTREEFDYVRDSVHFTPIPGSERGFWYEFPIPGGRLGVAHVLFNAGLTPAAVEATQLLDMFDPEVLAVVGIGGALDTELRLGDVVVGSVIQEYLKDAKVVPNIAFQPAGDVWPLAERMRNFTNNFQYVAEESRQSWVRFARVRGIDLPFATTPGARCEPEYNVSPIVSGDLLVTDPAFKDWLLSHDRKRAVIEMEGAGAARAVRAHDRDVALLVLRGISDFADEGKADLDAVVSGPARGAWRRYAAQNAIELLAAFLASPSFPWRKPVAAPTAEPDGTGPVDYLSDASPSRFSGAWDYFMRAAQLIEVTAAGIEIVRALRPDHSSADSGHRDSHGPADSHGHVHHDADGHDHHDAGHGHDPGNDPRHDSGHGADHEPGEHDYSVHHDVHHDMAAEPGGHMEAHLGRLSTPCPV